MRLKQKYSNRFYLLAIIFTLFQKGSLPLATTDEVLRVDDEETLFSRIRCPLCQWQPDASSLWTCDDCGPPEYFYDGCWAVWNTFNTRGLCPGCGHQWRWTSCLLCEGWSLHEDWYLTERGDNRL